ncbi:hypothetical protein M2165_002307 [Variovorax sp. TBS-050B]|uniref:SWIM zinc finger family protein n=1 Tax=Variovorax sp. TBS-050B TaxID=2940551 RepID=UPI002475507F|nr:SWIM zinc finger domain-containing protein [Variovorax sp. TBS-050B]MDH6592418.1 hypothetical protein [Variovorax sp. TBS-050B]
MAWHDGYRAYDDDTLAALANPGLLRRAAKDVEAGKLAWAEQGADGGVIAADGQRVQLDARGPQQARCDCPAPGICKHILGAALWLRALPPAAAAGTAEADPAPAAAAPDPLAEILALDAAALFKAAGVAAVRRAAAASTDAIEWRLQGAALVMELPELGAACRWVAGAGFAGMVSEVAAAERKAVHLMAIAALRRAQGRPLDWPEAARPAPVPEDGARLGERERAFLRQVESMLDELLSGGLSHVSELTSARLLALNMSARGEGLPRLAALLRNLGGTVDLLVRRDHRAEERDAFAQMARIHALCAALGTAQGELAAALRGRLRRDFDASAALELLPLGAHWWQTRGGARGLTLAFWDVAGERLLQATLARPDGSDASFTRQGAWTAHSLWPGVGTAQQVCAGALRLDGPRLADDGRLALAGATRAQPLPMWAAGDARLARLGCGRWAELGERLRDATGLAAETFDAVLLRPADTRAPVLDEVRQRLDWWLQDGDGQWLRLGIPVGPEHRQRIENLDRFAARRAPVHAVLVRIERSAARTELMPVAVLGSGAGGRLQVVSLDFADEPRAATSLANRILRLFEARQQQRQAPPAAAPSLLARLLGPVADVAEAQAATGRMALTLPQRQRLQEALDRAASVGLDALAQALRAHLAAPAPGALLRLGYLCELLAELDGLPERRTPQAA